MRPLKLRIEGFRSYAEETEIDFTGVDAVAITGPNGSGKSSIVEAIEHALYGEGRQGPHPSKYVNEDRASYAIDFEFVLGGERYRVERSYELGAKPKPHVQIYRAGSDGWVPTGGDTVRETQRAIERTLGMDHDTWAASSLILQGGSAAFTELDVSSRMERLAAILGVGFYERVVESARGDAREATGRAEAEGGRAAAIEFQLADRDVVRARLDELVRDRTAAEARLEAAADRVRGLRALVLSAGAERDAASAAADGIAEGRARVLGAIDRATAEHERAARELEALRREAEGANADLGRLERSAARAVDLEARAAALEADASVEEDRARELEEAVTQRSAEAAAAAQRASDAGGKLPELRKRIELLSRPDPLCFACGQPVTEEHRAAELASATSSLNDALLAASREKADQQASTDEAAGFRDQATAAAREARALRSDAEAHRQGAQRATRDGDRIPAQQERIADIERRITEKLAHVGDLEAEVADHRRALEVLVGSSEDRLRRARETAEAFAEVSQEMTGAEQARDLAASAVTGAAEAVAAVRAELERLGALGRELVEVRARDAAAAEEAGRHRLCAEAASKGGIPAIVVENALPQLVAEANLIAGLIDPRMSVAITKLKATADGSKIRETLDILVTIGSHTRELDALSGGQRLTADLALRVGLARLLARRAGRQIEALIIDESFLAFDAGRQQRVIEVLHQLTGEFPFLACITHNEELAASFEHRIEVALDGADHSHVEVRQAVAA